MGEYSYEIIDGIKCYNPETAVSNSYYPADVYETLYSLEQSNFWFKSRNRLILHFFKKYADLRRELKTLEIGCGTGFVLNGLKQFPSLKLHGAEVLLQGLKLASKRVRGVEFLQLDALNMPFDSEFDIICTFDVLEHIEDDARAINNIYKALRRKGLFFVTVPRHKFLWAAIDEMSNHKRRYAKAELASKLKLSGFSILHSTSFVFILFPVMMLSRMINKKKLPTKSNDEQDLLHEFRIPGLLNKIFGIFMLADELLIKMGLRLPFGGSLFIIALKR